MNRINQLWQNISELGVKSNPDIELRKRIILANRIALILTFLASIVFVLDNLSYSLKGSQPANFIIHIRPLLMAIITSSCLFFNKIRWFCVSRILLSIAPSFIILFFPWLVHHVTDELFLFFLVLSVPLSSMAYILFSFNNNKTELVIITIVFLLFILYADKLYFGRPFRELNFAYIYKQHYFIIKTVHIATFFFSNAVIIYLFNTNFQLLQESQLQNIILQEYKEEMTVQNEELYSQREELLNTNTELETLLEKLKETQNQLIQAEKMASIGVMVSGVAHEINNPINYISLGVRTTMRLIEKYIGEYDTLSADKKEQYKGEIDTLLQNADKGIEKVVDIVHSLKMMSSDKDVSKVPAKIDEVIDSALLILNPKLIPEIEIKKEYLNVPPVNMYVGKMHQAIINILDNAVHAIKSKKNYKNEFISLKINTQKEGDKEVLVISISNSGNEIPPSVQNKIFDAFYTTKKPGEGSGLGMYITYNIVKEHNGNLSLINQPNNVQFVIELPMS